MIQPKIFEDLSTTGHQTSFHKHHSKSIFRYKPIWIATCILFIICLRNIQAQETSLHLVKTITGTDEHNRVYNAKGIGDFNGDGYADYIVSFLSKDTIIDFNTYTTNYTNLYYGSSNFDTIPDFTFKNSLAYPIGDVNNDGYDDLMIYETNYSFYPPLTVFKIYKGSKQLDTVPIFKYTPPYLWKMGFTEYIENIGDLNGDGYRDFVISSPYNWDDGLGKVYIFHGGDSLSEKPAQILSYKYKKNGDSFFGSSVVGIGDINKDGYDDILISEQTLDRDTSNVQLFYGNRLIDSLPNKIFIKDEIDFGRTLNDAGDINKDNKDEFVITSYYKTYIYFNLDSVIIINNKKRNVCGVTNVCTGGDINNDGYNDFLISNDVTESMSTIVHGYYGRSILDTLEDFRIVGEQPYSSFAFGVNSNQMNIAGDINGDGYDDILICASSFRINEKQVGKVYIYSYNEISSIEKYNNKPNKFFLSSNYPNPFNPTTKLTYNIPTTSNVIISIYNLLGEKITTFMNEIKVTGEYEINFDANKYNLSSGTYFIEFNAEPVTGSTKMFHKVIKAVLLK